MFILRVTKGNVKVNIKNSVVNTRSTDGILLKNKLPHCESYNKNSNTVSTPWNRLDPSKRNVRGRDSF